MATSATSFSEETPRPWPLEVQALQQALHNQRNYNHLITTIISRFVEISPADLDQEIRHSLSLVRQATQVDGCCLSFC